MNRKSTVILACLVFVMALVALLSSRAGRVANRYGQTGIGGIGIDPDTLLQVRVQRDYWNTFTLERDLSGRWNLVEPSSEEAFSAAVNELIDLLARFPVVTRLDLPAGDSERFREYGLWEPSLEVMLTTVDGARVLQLGRETTDGTGVYCALEGEDGVMVTTQQAAQMLSRDLEAYRVPPAEQAMPQGTRVQIRDVRVGEGPPVQHGQRLAVHYTGRLSDGTEFDSSHSRGSPFTFTLGSGEVIKGWEQGLSGMRVGGKRQLTIPPDLGYGAQGKPPAIPANATLFFDIELLSAGEP